MSRPDLLHQVDRHVVRRPERRPERVGPGRGQPGDRLRAHARAPEHDTVALDVDATPAGPAGELGVLPRGDVGVRVAVPLDQLLDHHRPRGHVDPQRQRLGREHDPAPPRGEELLDALLERRQHPGVVRGDAAGQPLDEVVVAEDEEVGVRDVGAPLLDERADLVGLLRCGQPEVHREALLHRGVAPHPAEDEVDRREERGLVELVDDLEPGRQPTARRGTTAAAPGLPAVAGPGPVVAAGDLEQAGVHLRLRPGEAGPVREQVHQPPADHDVLVERHRPLLLDHGRRGAAHRAEPLAELLGVGDGRAQGHHGHRLREMDDDLLPDRPAHPVGQVVHLVHDDEAEAGEGLGAGVQHVAQHLGRHDDDGRLAVDGVVTGEQPDLVGTVAADEVVVLLVRERLDRRGVEALASLGEREVDRELADDRLARARGSGDEDAVAGLDRLAGPHLEVVEREVVERLEVREDGRLLLGAEASVAVGRGAHEAFTRTFRAAGTTDTVTGSGPSRSPSA